MTLPPTLCVSEERDPRSLRDPVPSLLAATALPKVPRVLLQLAEVPFSIRLASFMYHWPWLRMSLA